MIRKSLLYESKVEYGGWTINHVLGCAHGCKYPCYAMSMAKRTGRVKTYEDWCKPQVVENTIELLDDELRRFGNKIDSVHLCFTTDPFMWNAVQHAPISEVADLSTRIIEKLNSAGIRVTTLTKGVYPDAFVEKARTLSSENQYGVSIVSLSEEFRQKWEPGSAPVGLRLQSLQRLAESGAHTWVSVEPYPTPNIDATATNPASLLDAIAFVDKAVFGRWNYNRLVNSYADADAHYLSAAEAFASWAADEGKVLHIKRGTPLSDLYTADVLAVGK